MSARSPCANATRTTLVIAWSGYPGAAEPEILRRAARWVSGRMEPRGGGRRTRRRLCRRGGGWSPRRRAAAALLDLLRGLHQDDPDDQHQLVVDCAHQRRAHRRTGRRRLSAAANADRLRRGTVAQHRQARLPRAGGGGDERNACSTKASSTLPVTVPKTASTTIIWSASKASAPTRRRIAGCCCTISAASRFDSVVVAHLRERHDTTPEAFHRRPRRMRHLSRARLPADAAQGKISGRPGRYRQRHPANIILTGTKTEVRP